MRQWISLETNGVRTEQCVHTDVVQDEQGIQSANVHEIWTAVACVVSQTDPLYECIGLGYTFMDPLRTIICYIS